MSRRGNPPRIRIRITVPHMPTPSRETTAAVPGVVGRDAELARLADLLSRAGPGSAAVAVIRGETGCGKTHLLNAVAERARADGWKCLNMQGVESEAVLSGAGLLSVLSPLRGGLGSVPEAQAEALSAALGWGPAAGSGDRFLIGAATLSLLAAESSRTPLLIAVDDVQWVDAESADALAFAARRLGHDRVAVVMTHRVGTPLPVPLDGFEVIAVGGLAPGAARALLGPGFSADVVARLVSETGGNPLALRECQRVLSRAQRAGAAPLPQALPVPERLREVYAGELGDLSPGAWRAAVLCAASSDQEAAPVLAALAAEGLDPGDVLGRGGRGPGRPGRRPDVSASDAAVGHVGARLGVRASLRPPLARRRHPGPGCSCLAPRGGHAGPGRGARRRAGRGRRCGSLAPWVRRRLEGHGTRGPADSRPRASR